MPLDLEMTWTGDITTPPAATGHLLLWFFGVISLRVCGRNTKIFGLASGIKSSRVHIILRLSNNLIRYFLIYVLIEYAITQESKIILYHRQEPFKIASSML